MRKRDEDWIWPWLVFGLVLLAVFVVFTILWMAGRAFRPEIGA